MNAIRDFQNVGEELFWARLNNSHSGNLSVRNNRNVVISRTGAMLHRLSALDLIETGIDTDDSETPRASRELPVHRAIYLGTGAQAIVHAHPPHVVALSFYVDLIEPIDAEGAYYYPRGIPVLQVAQAVGSQEVAAKVTPLLREFPVVVVRGHGSFAVGETLDEGLHWTSSLDNVSQIILLSRMYKGCPIHA
jgi:L-fuculose-phosphate aldolase